MGGGGEEEATQRLALAQRDFDDAMRALHDARAGVRRPGAGREDRAALVRAESRLRQASSRLAEAARALHAVRNRLES